MGLKQGRPQGAPPIKEIDTVLTNDPKLKQGRPGFIT